MELIVGEKFDLIVYLSFSFLFQVDELNVIRDKEKRKNNKYLFTVKIKSNDYLLSNRQLLDNKCGKVSSG